MIKVIDTKPHRSVVKQCICRNCGVTLEYVPNDVKEETHGDYGGGSDTVYFLVCPNPPCMKRVYVKSNY